TNMLTNSLKSREGACAGLARSLVEDQDALMSDGDTKTVCSSWSLGVPVVEHRPDGASQLVVLWLHPSNLHLCFGKKKLFGSAVHGMHLAHLLAVRADDCPPFVATSSSRTRTNSSSLQYYLSFESFGGDVVVIAMPTQRARDALLHTFQDILKVIDVMATVQDHVELYLRTNQPTSQPLESTTTTSTPSGHNQLDDHMNDDDDSNNNNQSPPSPPKEQQLRHAGLPDDPETDAATTKSAPPGRNSAVAAGRRGDWTPADLDAWLHARQLSPLFVPLNTYLSDAYARGDAKATFFRLTPDIVDHVIVNQNQASASSSVVQLRQSFLQHVAKGRGNSRPSISAFLPRRRSTFRLY
ncbi:hypothetical protein DYB28_015050, partial [Aphanomyces astaci]